MTPASHDVRAFTALYPASCPRPSPSRIDSGHGSAVPETRLVVIGKHAEDRHSEPDRRQLLHARGRNSLGVLEAQPAEMWRVDKLGHARVDGGHHGLWTHRVYLDPDADFLRFVDDRLEIFQFFGGRPRLGGERLLAR